MWQDSEYRLQTWLTLFQVLAVMAAWLVTAINHSLFTHHLDEDNWVATIIRHLSILLILVPLLWAFVTIRQEKTSTSGWTKRHTLISGIILIPLLFIIAGLALNQGYSRNTIIQPITQRAITTQPGISSPSSPAPSNRPNGPK